MKTYDFGSGRTDPASFPTEALAEAAAAGVREVGERFVLYPGDKGHEGLRRIMAQRESDREGVPVDPDHLALTNGSMQGVTLVAEALAKGPGDIVVTEELTYSGTIGAYKGLGLRLEGVALDEHGMRVDSLEAKLESLHAAGTPPAFVYTLTTYQNPTGSVMPKSRRLELLEVARRYDVVVVEDNCYADVHFEGDKEPSLFALDDYPNQVYIGSVSKILGPGIRQGYLLAPPAMLGRLLDRRFDGGNSMLGASICAAYFKDRLWQHIEANNVLLKEKRDAVFAGLEEHVGDLCSWSKPVGGLFIWVGFPADVDREKLWNLVQEQGILCARGASFHIDRADIPYLRLAFGYPSLEVIREGIPVLADCIRQAQVGEPALAVSAS
ncbi:MAG: aminotransferase class I/II-fold pyridoxal phosphate-dependent enzyme [Candidatus Latescibacteria bacterium]|nr:aminotransferase class I/II-fold pyridoxal phosphate-dependent enzyme [Candidatus Latescibacterota bacterium]